MIHEVLDLVDNQDSVIGQMHRKEIHSSNTNFHREVAIFLYNKNKEILLAQRSLSKKVAPGWWDISAAGHILSGENITQAAKRELFEELGVHVGLKFFNKHLDINDRESRFFYCYYAIVDLTSFEFDIAEVSQVQWVKIDDLENFAKNNLYSTAYWSHKMILTIANSI